MVVMQVFLHLFLVLGKCNRVTTRVLLIFAVLLTLGLFHSQPSLSSFSFSPGLGTLSGYTLGFLFGLKFATEGPKGAIAPLAAAEKLENSSLYADYDSRLSSRDFSNAGFRFLKI